MSTTIHYRNMSKTDPHLKNVGAPGSFIQSMQKAFGRFPCELAEKDYAKLSGMAIMYSGSDDDNPYREVIDLIEKFGRIELYASY